MTTRYSKPVSRALPLTIKDGAGGHRALIATLHGSMLELRLFGRQKSEWVDLEGAYFGAIKARTFRAKMEKAKLKKAKGKK